jgi:hypothetical protein
MTFNFSNKYHAKKTVSALCERTFDSRAEARRGEELKLLEKAGAISELKYQVPFQLCLKPNIKIRIDFQYIETSSGRLIHEDTKGQTSGSGFREFRVKMAWLKEKFGVDVFLTS